MRAKLWNDMRNAIEEAESALFGCEQIEWEEFEELFSEAGDHVVLRPRITVGQMRRLKKALDVLNHIVNSDLYERL